MILKIYRKRGGWDGWRYIDKVSDVHVDGQSWCITNPIPKEKLAETEHLDAVVCAVIQAPEKLYKDTGRMTVLNRNSGLEAYEVMFNYDDILKNLESEDDFVTIKVINVVFDNGTREVFVTQHEPHTWLLNDAGKTVERI